MFDIKLQHGVLEIYSMWQFMFSSVCSQKKQLFVAQVSQTTKTFIYVARDNVESVRVWHMGASLLQTSVTLMQTND